MQAVTFKGQCQKRPSRNCSWSVLGEAAEGPTARSSLQGSESPADHVGEDPGALRGPFRLAEERLERMGVGVGEQQSNQTKGWNPGSQCPATTHGLGGPHLSPPFTAPTAPICAQDP